MSVSDGQLVNASVSNAAWISRLINSDTIGKLDLKNVSTTNLTDIQRIINEILGNVGLANQSATDPTDRQYSSNINIADNDTLKEAIEKLDAVLDVPEIRSLLLNFANDAAYEASYTATAGSIYYNTTDDQPRYYNVTALEWRPVGSSQAMIREVPTGLVNGVNTAYTLSFVPISDQHYTVFLDGTMMNNSEVSLLGNTVTFTTAPEIDQDVFVWYFHSGVVDPVTPTAGLENVEYHTVTAGEETAKQFNLINTPSTASKVRVDVIGGTAQHFGVDFTITGAVFDWSGFALDGFLAEDDVVRLVYLS